jgi:hypothetical protein
MRPVAFEYFEAASTAIVCEYLSIGPPFHENYPAYVLLTWDESETAMETAVEICGDLQFGPEAGVLDVRLAQNSNEAVRLWQYREAISESITATYAVHKHDISVPAAATADFLTAVSELLTRDFPGVRGVFFGHLGDNNLHLNFIPTENGPSEARFREMGPRIDASVFPLIVAAGGSISAEHGIGLLKKKYLHFSRSPAEIQLMRQIKAVFDPRQILNPGKVLPDPENGD